MNADVDSSNVDEICRLCLKGEGTILPIFGLEHSSRDCIPLSNKIKACVAVEISRNDELPKKICVGCVHQVDSWHKFKTSCDTAQAKLTSWLKSTTTTSTTATTCEIFIKQEPIDDEYEDDDVIICCDDDDDDVDVDIDDGAYASPPSIEIGRSGAADDAESSHQLPHIAIDVANDAILDADVADNRPHDENIDLDANVNAAPGMCQKQDGGDESTQLVIQSVGSHTDKSILESALEGGVVTGDVITEGSDVTDEIMMADFSDQLAPDVVELTKDDGDVNMDDDNDDDVPNVDECVGDENKSIINVIHCEINRRLSADYDLEYNDDDFDDVVSYGVEEDEEKEKKEIVNNNNDVGRVTRRSSKRYGEDTVVGESVITSAPESGMVIEAFTLADDTHARQFNGDLFVEEHESMLHMNGTVNSGRESTVDLDTVTVHSSVTYSDDVPMIKQEPLSPSNIQLQPESTKSEQKPGWSSELPPLNDLDIKPIIKDVLDDAKLKGRKNRTRIPCEPCGATYPDYLKWVRHCKSNKHKRNVRYHENKDRLSLSSTSVPPPTVPPSPPPISPAMLESIKKQSTVTEYNGIQFHICPIASCSKSFKHRRNLQSHVKEKHGFNLKDLERSERQPTLIDAYATPKPAPTPRTEKVNSKHHGNLPFSCNVCSKQFGYRRSLKNHMFIFHNVTPPTPRLKCSRCMKNFQKVTGLKSHMRHCGVFNKSKRCLFCNEDFPTYKDNMKHRAVCKKRYAAKAAAKSVVAAAKPPPPEHGTYSCRFCDITFQSRSIYTDHMEMYHPGEPLDVVADDTNETDDTQLEATQLHDTQLEATQLDDNIVEDSVNETSGEIPCEFCTKTFTSMEDFNVHVIEHQNNRSFECKLCRRVLTTMRYFQDHMRSHFIQHRGQYLCWTCYKPFNNRSDLNAHKKLHLKKKIFTCNICKHSFHNVTALDRHKRSHGFFGFDSETDLVVNSAKRSTLVKTIENEEMKESALEKEKVTEPQCQICKKFFSNQFSLDRHSKLHKPVNSEVIKKLGQVCNGCNKSFKSRLDLRSHYPHCKQTSESINVQGDIAALSNYNKVRLNKMALPHQRVQCDKCGSSFSKSIGLRKHIKMNRCPLVRQDYDKVHKSYLCRYCKLSLTTIVGLYKHLTCCKEFISKYGQNYNSKQCPTCHKQFSSLGVLYNHGRFCTGIISKQIKQEPGVESNEKTSNSASLNTIKKSCAYCDKSFTDLSSYKSHKKSCSRGESSSSTSSMGSYRCDGCSIVFFSEDRLKLHLKVCKFYRQTPVVMLTKQAVIEQCECGKVFSSKSSLEAHRAGCSISHELLNAAKDSSTAAASNSSHKLECEYCHKRFDKYQSRNSHLRICKVKNSKLYAKRIPVQQQQERQTKPTPSPLLSSPPPPPAPPPPPPVRHTSPISTTTPNHLPPPPPMIPLSSLSSPSFMCCVCNSLFATESDLLAHNCQPQQQQSTANASDSVEIMVEPDNPLNFNDYSDFGFHYMDDISQRESILKCLPCDKVFSSAVTLSKHRNLFHPNEAEEVYLIKADGSVQCPKCPRSFKDQKSMAHHMGWHTRLEDQSGQQQPQVSIANSYLQAPPSNSQSASMIPYVEQKTPFNCTYCNRSFTGKGQLQNHLKTHTGGMQFPSSSSPSSAGGEDASNPATTTLTYRCRFCSKRFRDKATMLEHQNLHKSILAAATSTSATTNVNVKPKPAAEPVPKYLVSCNMCRKILSSNSVAKHKKMHEIKGNITLSIPTLFTAINKPLTKAKQLKQQQYEQQQQYEHQQQYQQQQRQYQQQQQQYQQQMQQSMVPCSVCFRLFSGQRSLSEHMATEHGSYSKIDVVEIDDDDDSPGDYHTSEVIVDVDHGFSEGGHKCEICAVSFAHKSEYLLHLSTPGHRQMTKRLSAILNRVNNDLVHS